MVLWLGKRGREWRGGVMVWANLSDHIHRCEMLHCTRCVAKASNKAAIPTLSVRNLQMSVTFALHAVANSAVVMPASFFSLSISKSFRSIAIFVEAKRAGYILSI